MDFRFLTSIGTRIFLGCICMTLVTVAVGVSAQDVQRQLGDTARGIYDDAFIPMSYLRSAQSIVLNLSSGTGPEVRSGSISVAELQSALDALEVAEERAMSARGAAISKELRRDVAALQMTILAKAAPPDQRGLIAVKEKFDVAVAIYAADGLQYRRSVEDLVQRKKFQTYALTFGSVAVALLITFLLRRSIVPSIRRSVQVAESIAAGKLDNVIRLQGSGETADLLKALGTMQGSIAEKMACIETLMKQQASTYAADMAMQSRRFEAALDNMTMGLCMFDAEGGLLVHNRRFVEMFGLDHPDADIAAMSHRLRRDAAEAATPAVGTSRKFVRPIGDGRTICVSEEGMDGGGLVATYEDVTERQRAAEHLDRLARHDALTGLPNRIHFREEIERGILATRRGGRVAVLCLDLDRFKLVNDTLGHPIGDRLLQAASTRLLQATLPTDKVVRLGGDEFAVIRRIGDDVSAASRLAESLIAALNEPFIIEGHHVSIGVSIGISHTGTVPLTPDDLLKNADLALYQAKADGRGMYRLFRPEMERRLHSKRMLEVALRAAMSKGRLEMHYQPLVDAVDGKVVALEALLRWRDPVRGYVPPAEFIPIAEETGLIHQLGLWILDRACCDAASWPDGVSVAINLSPCQFRNPNLVRDVKDVLRRSGLPASRLEFEITESVLMQDDEATLDTLHEMRGLGIRIAMDDFGTGYSSVSYLRRFPFDKIKIDRSFISDIGDNVDDLAIVRALITLGRSLRMTVVAEGVETESQRTLLREAGCQEMQGYLFSRPQPASAAIDMIGRTPLARVA